MTCEALQVVVGWMDAVALKGWIYHVKIWAEKIRISTHLPRALDAFVFRSSCRERGIED